MAVPQEPDEPRPDRRNSAVLRHHRQAEADATQGRRATDLVDELEIGGAATKCDVLSVVRRRARIAFPLRKGLHRPAEGRPRLEEMDVVRLFRQLESGSEPGETAADDRDLHRATTAFIFSTVDRCGVSLNTS